jgi:hypothetical protein
LTLEQFWDSTVLELNYYIEAYGEKKKDDLRNLIIANFHGARFFLKGQSKGLSTSDLREALGSFEKEQKMSDREMFEVLKSMC